MGELSGITANKSAEGEAKGSTTSPVSQRQMESMLSQSELRRIGMVYDKDAPISSVVAKEMGRIQQAFDKRVVDHTEELVTKVQAGQPLGNKAPEAAAAGKKK